MSRDEGLQPPGIIHAAFDPRGHALASPGQKRRQQQCCRGTMRTLDANVRGREIGAAEAYRAVGRLDVTKHDEGGLLGLKQPLVRRDRDRVRLVDAGQDATILI